MARLVSKIYGEALFNYAKEQNQLEKMCEEAYDILAVLESSNELKDFIVNPKISLDEKISFIRDLFVKNFWSGSVAKVLRVFHIEIKKGEDPKILDFVALVFKKGRQGELKAILRHFIHETLKCMNIGEAEVVTAKELNELQKSELSKKLIDTTDYKNFIIDYKVDESVMAGIRIKIDGKVFDNTLKTKVTDISKSLRGLKYD